MTRFVGRDAELAWASERLDDAASGSPRTLVISGDAGVGKTRLLDEIARLALGKGMRVWLGRGQVGAPEPFGAVVPLIHELAAGSEARALSELWQRVERRLREPGAPVAQDLGASAGDTLLPTLADAFVEALVARARRGGLLLALDDLPLFDGASSALVRHVIAALSSSLGARLPLAIAATAGTGASRAAAQELLWRLAREEGVEIRALGGLGVDDCARLLEELGFAEPSRALAAQLQRETKGNPLHLRHLALQLEAADAVRDRGGAAVPTLPPGAVERSLSELIRSAVARVGDHETRAVLEALAAVGRAATPAELAELLGIPAPAVRKALERAARAHTLSHEEGGYAFADALLAERVRSDAEPKVIRALHARLWRRCGPADTAARAYHGLLAGDAVPAEALRQDLDAAARRAMQARDWPGAAALFEAAIERSVEIAPGAMGELHYRAGLAHFRALDARPALAHFTAARELLARAGERDGAASARIEALRSHASLSGIAFGQAPDDLDELARDAASTEFASAPLRAYALSVVGEAFAMSRDFARARVALAQALALARELGTDRSISLAHAARGVAAMAALEPALAEESFREALRHARRSDDPWLQGMPLQRLPTVLVWQGMIDEALGFLLRARALWALTHDDADYSLVLGTHCAVALARGEGAEIERLAREAAAIAARTGYAWGAALALSALAVSRSWRGDAPGALAAIAMLETPGEILRDPPAEWGAIASVARLRLAALARAVGPEQIGLARGIVSTLAPYGADAQTLSLLCVCVDVAQIAGDAQLATDAAAPIAIARARGVQFTPACDDVLDRALAAAAAARGDSAAAERQLERALDAAERAGAAALVARVLLLLAELAPDAQRVVAAQRARALAERLGLTTFAERSRDLSTASVVMPSDPPRFDAPGVEGASIAAVGPDLGSDENEEPRARAVARTRITVLVSDIEDSVALFQRIGDEAARTLMAAHNRCVRTALRRNLGSEVQQTGDGFILAFGSAAAAVRCAVEIQREFAAGVAGAELARQVRVGIHSGELVIEEGRLFGTAMNVAARICGAGRGGEIIMSESVRSEGEALDWAVECLGPVALRGVTGAVELMRVHWQKFSPE